MTSRAVRDRATSEYLHEGFCPGKCAEVAGQLRMRYELLRVASAELHRSRIDDYYEVLRQNRKLILWALDSIAEKQP